MRKRLKNSSEVAHFWANQSQLEGRSANLYFEGKSIYSYGSHFHAGELVKDVRGETVALFTDRTHSVTTAKHMGLIRIASNHFPGFTVPSFEEHSKNLTYLLNGALTSKSSLFRIKKRHLMHLGRYRDAARAALDYHKHFKKWVTLKTLEPENQKYFRELKKYDVKCLFNSEMDFETGKPNFPLKPTEIKTLNAKIDRADFLELTKATREPRLAIEREKRQARKDVKQKETMKESIAKWRDGAPGHFPWHYGGALLRLNKDKTCVETSKGAEISVKMALRLWDKIKARQSVQGFDFGPYKADGFDDEVLTVGCHRIPLNEIKGIALALGVS